MSAVTASAQPRRAASPPKWWPALLVFGLLVGLVGMHGLAIGGSAAAGEHGSAAAGWHHSSAAAVHAGVPDMWGTRTDAVCRSDGGDGGHAQHTDATCASGALSPGPGLPAPLAAAPGTATPPVGGLRSAVVAQEGGRAPPSLTELQLLRI
jgi:hypothetical protein